MRVRFVQSISDTVRGAFIEGRVINIDPAAPDFPMFQQWLKAGVIVAVREGDIGDPSGALETAVAPAQSSRGRGQGKPRSASRRGRA